MKKIIKTMVSLIEAYLFEYCKVNGVKETKLRNELVIYSNVKDLSITVVNKDDDRDDKIGIRYIPGNKKYEVYGSILFETANYPKTNKLINKLEL